MTKPRVKPLEWKPLEWHGMELECAWCPLLEESFFAETTSKKPEVEAMRQRICDARILSALDLTPDPAVQALVDIASIASAHLHQLARDRDLSEGELDFMRRVDAALAAFDNTKENK